VRSLRYIASEALPRILDRQGYKTSAIARELGLSRSYLSLIVKGKRPLGEDLARRIAQFVRLPVDILFMTEEEPS